MKSVIIHYPDEIHEYIQRDELARTDDTTKILFKIYLDMPLRGGRLREPCYLYKTARITEHYASIIEDPWKIETEIAKRELSRLLRQFIVQGFWELSETTDVHYDRNGKEFLPDEGDITKISKSVTITKTTRFYIDAHRDIRLLRGGRK